MAALFYTKSHKKEGYFMEFNSVKTGVMALAGAIGGAVASFFGGWNASMTTLFIFMAVDYITGLLVALVFKASPKTKNGAAESRAGFKGLCRKGAILLVVLVGHRLDLAMGLTFIKDAVVIAFIANETLSIIENIGLMGVDMPPVVVRAIEVLKKKSESEVFHNE